MLSVMSEPLIQPPINQCKVADVPFNAYVNGQSGIGLFAMSARCAEQKAVEHFKLKARDRHLIQIRPARKVEAA